GSAGRGVGSPGPPPSPPLSGPGGAPSAVVPLPSKSAVRSMTVTSAWNVVLYRFDIAAGLFRTTEASPQATAVPALARPRFLTLFSRIWKPDASAWPAASTPRTPSARAEKVRREAACMGEISAGVPDVVVMSWCAYIRRRMYYIRLLTN